MLQFDELRKKNLQRAEALYPAVVCSPVSAWAEILAKDVAETCTLLNKLAAKEMVELSDLGDQVAEAVINADLLMIKCGLHLDDFVKKRFNEVSYRRESNIFL